VRVNQIQKIVWAVDPYSTELELEKKAVRAIHAVSNGVKSSVQPVFVLVPDQVDLIASMKNLIWIKQYKSGAEKRLGKHVSDAGLKYFDKPRVLIDNKGTIRSAIAALVDFAEEVGGDMIVLSTHPRRGIPRFLVGSFAERLLIYSRVPALIVNPSTETAGSINRIMFPTDFSDECFKSFRLVLRFAKLKNAKVKIFHQIARSVDHYLPARSFSMSLSENSVDGYAAEEERVKERMSRNWLSTASEAGVKCDREIVQGDMRVDRAILACAQRDPVDLIAMTSRTGTLASALLGSVTRQVVRDSYCPVWVGHFSPENKEIIRFSEADKASLMSGDFNQNLKIS